MNLQFVTAAPTDAELHFDDIASLDGPAKLMVSQVGIDIFRFMRRFAPVIDSLYLLAAAVESHPECTFLVSPTLVLPPHVEREVFAGTSRHEFLLC